MNESLKRLRDAVAGRGREVEVAANGEVREINKSGAEDPSPDAPKPTKLADRTFGVW